MISYLGLVTETGIVRHSHDLREITFDIYNCVHGYSLLKNDAIITTIAAMIAYSANNATVSEILFQGLYQVQQLHDKESTK